MPFLCVSKRTKRNRCDLNFFAWNMIDLHHYGISELLKVLLKFLFDFLTYYVIYATLHFLLWWIWTKLIEFYYSHAHHKYVAITRVKRMKAFVTLCHLKNRQNSSTSTNLCSAVCRTDRKSCLEKVTCSDKLAHFDSILLMK